MQSPLYTARVFVFGLTIALSFPVLGLSAHWASLSVPDPKVGFTNFEGIGIAASVLTLLFVTTFLIVGIIRKNAVIANIAVELPTLIILSVLFLAGGVVTGDFSVSFFGPAGCSPVFLNDFGMQICKEVMAIKNVSFTVFAIMAAYWLTLLIMTMYSLMQGRNVFDKSVREANFSAQELHHANIFSGGIIGEAGAKDSTGGLEYDQDQQQQLELQQIQLQQLQQQQVLLQQQQYMVQQQKV